jgi:hypothetical protein
MRTCLQPTLFVASRRVEIWPPLLRARYSWSAWGSIINFSIAGRGLVSVACQPNGSLQQVGFHHRFVSYQRDLSAAAGFLDALPSQTAKQGLGRSLDPAEDNERRGHNAAEIGQHDPIRIRQRLAR